eukprot:gnl/Ergobibamus_cyprinoides/1240.p2 GENE.gnl/Ergobibamus_cyprinoides/1240~~gnl/Ergobibamus_cyprinoides/1240.p2  ORF type:complete len:151 (+),score=25.13 gnl/Ergobibamus_cyprinoides/1240:26-454(+)
MSAPSRFRRRSASTGSTLMAAERAELDARNEAQVAAVAQQSLRQVSGTLAREDAVRKAARLVDGLEDLASVERLGPDGVPIDDSLPAPDSVRYATMYEEWQRREAARLRRTLEAAETDQPDVPTALSDAELPAAEEFAEPGS